MTSQTSFIGDLNPDIGTRGLSRPLRTDDAEEELPDNIIIGND